MLVTVTSEWLPSDRTTSARPWIPGLPTQRRAGRSLRLQRWPAGRTAATRTDGGDTATADMAGSGRCSGHSPFTISTTTPSGVTASASGTTVIPTSMPRSLRLTDATPSPPIPDRARPDEDIAESLRCSSSAAMTAANLPAISSIRSSRRYSRIMRRNAPLWTILPLHWPRPPR